MLLKMSSNLNDSVVLCTSESFYVPSDMLLKFLKGFSLGCPYEISMVPMRLACRFWKMFYDL